MKITQVTVRFSVTANLGNYNSVKIEMESVAEVGMMPPAIVREKLLDELKAEVYEAVATIKGTKKKTTQQEDLL